MNRAVSPGCYVPPNPAQPLLAGSQSCCSPSCPLFGPAASCPCIKAFLRGVCLTVLALVAALWSPCPRVFPLCLWVHRRVTREQGVLHLAGNQLLLEHAVIHPFSVLVVKHSKLSKCQEIFMAKILLSIHLHQCP